MNAGKLAGLIRTYYPEGRETEFINVYPDVVDAESEPAPVGIGSIGHTHPEGPDSPISQLMQNKKDRLPFVHAAVTAFIVVQENGRDYLLSTARSMKKKYGGLLESVSGGHIGAGENVRTAVSRELAEELGIDIQDVPIVGYKRYENKRDDNTHDFVALIRLDSEQTRRLERDLESKNIRLFVADTAEEFDRYTPDKIEASIGETPEALSGRITGKMAGGREVAYAVLSPFEVTVNYYRDVKTHQGLEGAARKFAWVTPAHDGNFLGNEALMSAALAKYRELTSGAALTNERYQELARSLLASLFYSENRSAIEKAAVKEQETFYKHARALLVTYQQVYTLKPEPLVTNPGEYFKDRPGLLDVHLAISGLLSKVLNVETSATDRTDHHKVAVTALGIIDFELQRMGTGARLPDGKGGAAALPNLGQAALRIHDSLKGLNQDIRYLLDFTRVERTILDGVISAFQNQMVTSLASISGLDTRKKALSAQLDLRLEKRQVWASKTEYALLAGGEEVAFLRYDTPTTGRAVYTLERIDTQKIQRALEKLLPFEVIARGIAASDVGETMAALFVQRRQDPKPLRFAVLISRGEFDAPDSASSVLVDSKEEVKRYYAGLLPKLLQKGSLPSGELFAIRVVNGIAYAFPESLLPAGARGAQAAGNELGALLREAEALRRKASAQARLEGLVSRIRKEFIGHVAAPLDGISEHASLPHAVRVRLKEILSDFSKKGDALAKEDLVRYKAVLAEVLAPRSGLIDRKSAAQRGLAEDLERLERFLDEAVNYGHRGELFGGAEPKAAARIAARPEPAVSSEALLGQPLRFVVGVTSIEPRRVLFYAERIKRIVGNPAAAIEVRPVNFTDGGREGAIRRFYDSLKRRHEAGLVIDKEELISGKSPRIALLKFLQEARAFEEQAVLSRLHGALLEQGEEQSILPAAAGRVVDLLKGGDGSRRKLIVEVLRALLRSEPLGPYNLVEQNGIGVILNPAGEQVITAEDIARELQRSVFETVAAKNDEEQEAAVRSAAELTALLADASRKTAVGGKIVENVTAALTGNNLVVRHILLDPSFNLPSAAELASVRRPLATVVDYEVDRKDPVGTLIRRETIRRKADGGVEYFLNVHSSVARNVSELREKDPEVVGRYGEDKILFADSVSDIQARLREKAPVFGAEQIAVLLDAAENNGVATAEGDAVVVVQLEGKDALPIYMLEIALKLLAKQGDVEVLPGMLRLVGGRHFLLVPPTIEQLVRLIEAERRRELAVGSSA